MATHTGGSVSVLSRAAQHSSLLSSADDDGSGSGSGTGESASLIRQRRTNSVQFLGHQIALESGTDEDLLESWGGSGARLLRVELPWLFWGLICVGNPAAYAALPLSFSRALCGAHNMLWLALVPLNSLQLAHLWWQVSTGVGFTHMHWFPLHKLYFLDSVFFALMAALCLILRACVFHLDGIFMGKLAADMQKYDRFWRAENGGSKDEDAAPEQDPQLSTTPSMKQRRGEASRRCSDRMLGVKTGAGTRWSCAQAGMCLCASLLAVFCAISMPSRSLNRELYDSGGRYIFHGHATAEWRHCLGALSLGLMLMDYVFYLYVALHPIYRAMSTVDGLHAKLGTFGSRAASSHSWPLPPHMRSLKLMRNVIVKHSLLQEEFRKVGPLWFWLLFGCPFAQFWLFVQGCVVFDFHSDAGILYSGEGEHLRIGGALGCIGMWRYCVGLWFLTLILLQIWPMGSLTTRWVTLHGTALQQVTLKQDTLRGDDEQLIEDSTFDSAEWARLLTTLRELQESSGAALLDGAVRISPSLTIKYVASYNLLAKLLSSVLIASTVQRGGHGDDAD
jgi:hypothetical protein